LKLLLQGVCFENLSISAKKTIAMVALDLDNVHDVVSNISKFVVMICSTTKEKKKTMAIQKWSIWTEW
jgi:hypothetical protein